jgi:hypothetical protein
MPLLNADHPPPQTAGGGAPSWLGYAIIVLALLALAGGVYWALSRPDKPVMDEIGCFRDAPPSELIAIMIDRTDEIGPKKVASIINALSAVKDGTFVDVTSDTGDRLASEGALPRWTEFRAYTVGPVSKETLPVEFRACFPGNPEDVDITIESRRRAEQQWAEFNQKFQGFLSEIRPDSRESQSPLIESIRSVGATTFVDPRFNTEPKTRKRLIIVSNMLQNSTLFSHYRVWRNCRTTTTGAIEQCVEKNPKKGETCTMFGGRKSQFCESYEKTDLDFKKWKSVLGPRLNAEIRGVEVDILYIRGDSAQGTDDKLLTFWKDYFADNDAVLRRVKHID